MLILILLAYHSYCQSIINIYIESLCSDTQKAMIEISNTTIDQLDQLANVTFIPAGKFELEEYNTYYTKCQHKEQECYGNMILACALRIQENQKNSTQFIRCFYQHIKLHCKERDDCFAVSLKQCLTTDQRIQTLMCANGPQGIEFLFQNMKLTQKQKLNFVPSVELNGSLIKLQEDFGRLICKKEPSSEVCENLKWL